MYNLIKRIYFYSICVLLLSSLSVAQDSHKTSSSDPVGVKTADGMLYGKEFDPSVTTLTFGELMASVENNNDKVVVVKGSVAEVCQGMGCWMVMTDGSKSVRATTAHEFFLPKDIAGKDAVIYGKFKVTELSEEDAKHYNEESKNPVNPETIVGPQKAFIIEAIGIKIVDPPADSN